MIESGASASKGAHLCAWDVSYLLLWYVKEVENTVVAHHCQPIILGIKGNLLDPLIHLDLGHAEFGLEELACKFEEGEPTNKIITQTTSYV